LYALVETVEPRFLGRWFADKDGSLFEGAEVDFVAEQIALFEHEGGPDDRTALAGLAQALTLPPDQALIAAEAYVDLAAFRRYWAALAVVGQFDGFPYSIDDYHVYDDPTTGKLCFLPWGMDETYYRWWRDPDNVIGKLAVACEQVPTCRNAWIDEVWDIVAMTEQMDLVGRIDTLIARTEQAVLDDTRKAYTNDQVAIGRAGVYEFVARRRNDLEDQFLSPWQPPPPPPTP
jgi:spore coat protein CotH